MQHRKLEQLVTPQRGRSGVAHLFNHAKRLQRLQRGLMSVLEPRFETHVQVAALDHGVLTLIADSGAWSTRIRYQSRQLVASLKQQRDFRELQSIKVKIHPPSEVHTPEKHIKPIPESAALMLRELAAETEDESLKEALSKLAQHTQTSVRTP